MGVAAPPKKLIEQYMIEIAKSFNVPFEPDPSAMMVSLTRLVAWFCRSSERWSNVRHGVQDKNHWDFSTEVFNLHVFAFK